MIEKIVQMFEENGCPPVVVMKTSRAGDLVDNGYGGDFELAPYAVIIDGEHTKTCHDAEYKFDRETGINIMVFELASCTPTMEALVNELHERDDYIVVWQRDKGIITSGH